MEAEDRSGMDYAMEYGRPNGSGDTDPLNLHFCGNVIIYSVVMEELLLSCLFSIWRWWGMSNIFLTLASVPEKVVFSCRRGGRSCKASVTTWHQGGYPLPQQAPEKSLSHT